MENRHSVILRLESMQYYPRNIHSLYRIFFEKILSDWNSDTVVLDLLTAIILFNPNRPNLTHRDSVKVQQQTYMYLLQRYLLLRYRDETESQAKCERLLRSLYYLEVLAEKKVQNCLEIDRKIVAQHPLLLEVFDLPSMSQDIKPSNLMANIFVY
ncbi:unnamed protein product [Oppiella nova]|uniref:NR LBD domain-containing protein n=1 Tax=Oppiella nova TaxID=334625 RepID=A0A7R9ME15_9ACAR|nr:unnamed protein product [Oppiella nova]CAG2175490.1 unnamed protein product [Oppiella nova]